MHSLSKFFLQSRRIFLNKDGNIAIMAALLMPVIAGIGGAAIDTSNIVRSKSQLQAATDAAALAASAGLANQNMTDEQAKEAALDFISAHMANRSSGSYIGAGDAPVGSAESEDANPDAVRKSTNVSISSKPTGVGSGKTYQISVQASLNIELNPMTKLLGLPDVTLRAESQSSGSTATESALSMFLVLDRSGSMSEATNKKGVNKIDSLKVAVEGLMAQFKKVDSSSTFVRTAAVSYNNKMDVPGDLTWSRDTTLAYVKKLTATGATDSSEAMKTAHARLIDPKETSAHVTKTGIVPRKFMVFMTDGDNTAAKNDTDTKVICDKARADKVTVYTVAFMAPKKGKSLLEYCATSKAEYFQAEDAQALTDAFASIGRDASRLAVKLTN